MPTSPHDNDTHPEQAELELLAAELGRHGLRGRLCAPPGNLPYLRVTNAQAAVLAERIYARADAYWYNWAEKIADTDNPAYAARRLARVLATVSAPAGE
jgi:hypothetical protein